MDCEGSGLYTLQSTCNHSCEPNAEVTFPNNNNTLAVKALQDITSGQVCAYFGSDHFVFQNQFSIVKCLFCIEFIYPFQEILISYLDECARERSRHSRQKILRYVFFARECCYLNVCDFY